MKKNYNVLCSIFMATILLLFIVCCNSADKKISDKSGTTTSQDTTNEREGQRALLNKKMHIVYLDKDKFLEYAKTKRGKNEKLAFQFAIEDPSTGDFTLGLYAQNGKKFSEPYFLQVGKEYGDDITDKKIRFSTQKLIKKDVEVIVEVIEKVANNIKYVAFAPSLDLADNKIYYTVFLFREDQRDIFTGVGFTIEKFEFGPLPYNINTNPSPPATFEDDAVD
ncbi:MAG TPA: hypothetical protein VM888_06615 [Chitinophagaceae bacterium]|nr:hypothetical protein [Chitinophagaceae bacterium]